MPQRLFRAVTSLWTHGRPVERAAHLAAAVLFTSGLFHAVVFLVDGGPWAGPVSWRKAVTFGVSFGVTLACLVWVSSYVAMRPVVRRVLLGAFTAASVAEVAGITAQAWREVPSHFNYEDGTSSAITATLAAGGAVIVASVLVLTVLSLRPAPATAPSMRLAVRAGLVILMGAMISGAVMIAVGVTLANGGEQTAAYETAGWLKPTHAVTMHAVGVLPVLALVLSATRLDERRRTRVVASGAAAYALAALVTVAVNLAAGR
ncbi:hypothetical protein AB0I28_16045 [Phytomonospora sp. NPDC050363]|uniref:hypothetical protein n=1 Tax=Phytomonospora sp. NPDC050363 TaxID=3155642 RepID=UPI0033DFA206